MPGGDVLVINIYRQYRFLEKLILTQHPITKLTYRKKMFEGEKFSFWLSEKGAGTIVFEVTVTLLKLTTLLTITLIWKNMKA